MPKQILVANKSRTQKIKVNFRQSSFSEQAQKLARISKTNDMGRVWSANQSFTESVKCMTFPGQFLRFTYSSGRKNSRTKEKNKQT